MKYLINSENVVCEYSDEEAKRLREEHLAEANKLKFLFYFFDRKPQNRELRLLYKDRVTLSEAKKIAKDDGYIFWKKEG